MSIFDWIAIIGVFAWLPCAYPIFIKGINKPVVDILTSKIILIGFDTYGPIINLRLAFSTKHHDLIINNFEITLEHEEGGRKIFEWQGVNLDAGLPIMLGGGFMTTAMKNSILAIKLNQKDLVGRFIICCDPSFISAKDDLTIKLNKKIRLESDKLTFDPAAILESKEILDLKDRTLQSFTWKEGEYIMTIKLGSLEKFKVLNNHFYFSLSVADVEELMRNKEEVMKSFVLDLTNDSQNNPRPKWYSTNIALTNKTRIHERVHK